MSQLRMLSVRGNRLVDPAGRSTTLRGYNVGGWLNMENFLTGFPSVESLQRQALRRTLGPHRCRLFFDTFLATFFTDDDARYLTSLGLNSVRIPLNYRHFEDDDRPFELKDSGFALLDSAVDTCRRNGLYAVLDLHALPGSQNRHWHSDNATHRPAFWTHRHFQDRAVHLWVAIAERYAGEAAVAGYNVMNEPGDASGSAIKPFYDRVVAAIRRVDPDHVIFLDGNRYATDFSAFEGVEVYPNTVYSAHDYALPAFAFGGAYPGLTRGEYVDRGVLEETFLQRTTFMRETGTPIWIGEFGPVFTGDPLRDESRYRLLADQIEIYDQHAASWALWGYKDIGGQGLVYAHPDSPWRQRIAPVTAKKARLGVDVWGSVDDGVRHILDPIEATFRREYPDFDPYPFGVADWLALLVRDIMLAEPMLDDFARCFAGVADDATVVALAESFRIDRCVRREPLARLLAEKAGAAAGLRSVAASDTKIKDATHMPDPVRAVTLE